MAIGGNLVKSESSSLLKKKETELETENKDNIKSKSSKRVLNKDTEAEIKRLKKELQSDEVIDDNSRLLVVFPVGKEEYAMEIDRIKEVVPAPEISPIPQSADYIKGVANVRGNVLAIIDLAVKFGLKGQKKSSDEINYVVVINSEDIKVAVASSQVPETLMVLESNIDSANDVMRKTSGEQSYIKGVIKYENRMIILLDVIEMVSN